MVNARKPRIECSSSLPWGGSAIFVEMADERPTPRDEDIPGGFPVTPSVNSIDQITPTGNIDRQLEAGFAGRDTAASPGFTTYDHVTAGSSAALGSTASSGATGALTSEPQQQHAPVLDRNSSSSTILPHGESSEEKRKSKSSANDDAPDEPIFAPIKSHTENE